jgi:hypothetical protein
MPIGQKLRQDGSTFGSAVAGGQDAFFVLALHPQR